VNQVGKHMTPLILLLLVTVSLGVAGEDQKWQLEIGLSKKTYLLREPIWLDLSDLGVETVVYDSDGGHDNHFHLRIEDPDGTGN